MHPQLNLPQPRRLYVPPPNHVLLECDLAGADAQVAAHECGGPFRNDFFSGVKMHRQTMERFWPHLPNNQEPEYTRCKNLLYGTLYGGKPPTISAESGAPLKIAREFQPWIFQKYPDILAWQRRKTEELFRNGGVSNAFGYRVYYFDRLDRMVPEALNWVPSSTVAEVCFRGMKAVRRAALSGELKYMARHGWFSGARLQVHDSSVFVFPIECWPDYAIRINELLHVPVPYPNDPLVIPWSIKVSTTSWGDAVDIDWDNLDLERYR